MKFTIHTVKSAGHGGAAPAATVCGVNFTVNSLCVPVIRGEFHGEIRGLDPDLVVWDRWRNNRYDTRYYDNLILE